MIESIIIQLTDVKTKRTVWNLKFRNSICFYGENRKDRKKENCKNRNSV